MTDQIMGYKRPDGRFGIRNIVLILSLVQCANSTASRIGLQCDAPYIGIDTGCGQGKVQAARTDLGLIAAGANPNVYGVLLVSLGCQWVKPDVIGPAIEKTGKKVCYSNIQDEGGMPEAVEKGVRLVREMQAEAEAQRREPCPVSGLVVGVNCGGSDWTTAITGNTAIGEMTDILVGRGGSCLMSEVYGFPGSDVAVAQNAATYEIGLEILDMVRDLRADFLQKNGQPISEVNPSPGNKEGGITTLCEKSMGNVKKMGSVPIQGILKLEDRNPPRPGMWIVDQRLGGNDAYPCTAYAMLGAHAIVFCTGRGTPIGNAVAPVIKVTGNSESFRRLNSMMDFDAGAPLRGEATIAEMGRDLYRLLLEVCEGKRTKAEINGDITYLIPAVIE